MGIKCVDHSKEGLPKSILHFSKSICKIDNSNKIASGFLIKFQIKNRELFYIMTNESSITSNMIEQKQLINFYYDNGNKTKEIVLNSDKRYIKNLRPINIDAIIIEILPEDNIEIEFFLLPETHFIYDFSKLLLQDITIIHYSSNEITYSNGIIYEIHNNEFFHSAFLEEDLSGTPIILEKSQKVIGIHKLLSTPNKSDYYADFLIPLLNFFDNFSEFRVCLTDGNYYIGNLKGKIPNGKGKFYNYKGKIKYEGDFMGGKYMGIGKYIYDNENYYIGQFINGKKYGKGKIYNKKGNMIYEGHFIDNKPEGIGKYIFENGDYYIGPFKNGLSHGKGILYYPNGNIKYEGEFVEDKFQGNGKFIWENGNYYIGKFKDNLRNGKGILYNKDGSIRYEGDFICGKFEGKGKYYFENGNYYVGKWNKDLRNGKGVIYYKNGKVKYKGDFVDDKKEGNGILMMENGEYYEGQWKNDLKNGKGIEYDENWKIKYKGNFINGKRMEN